MHNHSDTGAAVPAPDSEVWKKGFAVNWAQQEREMSDALGAYTNEGSDTDAVVDPEDDDDEDEDEAGGAGPEESSSASTTQVSVSSATSRAAALARKRGAVAGSDDDATPGTGRNWQRLSGKRAKK